MTTAIIRRRLEAVESIVMPKPQKPLRIIFEPGTDDPTEWAQHAQDIVEAQENGDRLAVVRSITPGVKREQMEVEGVRYYDTDWEAELAALGPEAMRELRDSVMGNIFGVATDAVAPDDDCDD